MSDHDVIDDGRAEEPTGDDAGLLRELIVQAHPDVVPELVQGASLREMLDSLPAAKAAYARIAEAAASASPAPVPSGSAIRSREPNRADLSPAAKVRAALDAARR
ncbi:MAG TPA: hypothetical protein PKA95_06295 [Thermomicrobiales bacterium]|nr:hypothetical protein [Thermomicrobiales bacterium]